MFTRKIKRLGGIHNANFQKVEAMAPAVREAFNKDSIWYEINVARELGKHDNWIPNQKAIDWIREQKRTVTYHFMYEFDDAFVLFDGDSEVGKIGWAANTPRTNRAEETLREFFKSHGVIEMSEEHFKSVLYSVEDDL